MRDELLFDFPRPFHPVQSEHVVCEREDRREIGRGRVTCLLFVVHGTVTAGTGESCMALTANEACILEPRDAVVELRCARESELYLVRFRRPPGYAEIVGPGLAVPDRARVGAPGRLTHLLRLYIEEAHREKVSRLILHQILVLALSELAHDASMPVRGPCLESIASRVDAFVAAHYHQPLGTTAIARELRYNPYYLERAYHQERGKSIREAIHERRIKEACAQLLLSGNRGVAEIAALCGYRDAGYFRRVFKRATHQTPHHFRAAGSATRQPAGPALRS